MRILALSAALVVAALTGFAAPASAGPWDESGSGRWRYERSDYRQRDHWRERRMHRFHGPHRHRHRYVSRYRYSYPAYGYYRERTIRRMYRGRHHHPAYNYYRY